MGGIVGQQCSEWQLGEAHAEPCKAREDFVSYVPGRASMEPHTEVGIFSKVTRGFCGG